MINDNDIKEEGLYAICQSQTLTNIEYLDISFNDLKVNGAYIVSVSGNFK